MDSFNWDELRRNTREIEELQKAAVDRYWNRQGGGDGACFAAVDLFLV